VRNLLSECRVISGGQIVSLDVPRILGTVTLLLEAPIHDSIRITVVRDIRIVSVTELSGGQLHGSVD
jgi:hypothetical protein